MTVLDMDRLEVPEPECKHPEWQHLRDDYGSLASGGSFAVYRCTSCGKRLVEQLAD
mgnify:CR=1 FL=1